MLFFAAKGSDALWGHVEDAVGAASSLAPNLQPPWSVGPLLLPKVFTFECGLTGLPARLPGLHSDLACCSSHEPHD